MNQLARFGFSIVSVLATVYLVLVLISLVSRWFMQGAARPNALKFIDKLVEPYLRPFRSLKFLQIAGFDLSPILALMLLQIVVQVFSVLSSGIVPRFGYILALILTMLGSSIGSLFLIFAVLAAIRLVAILVKASTVNRIWFFLDTILQPMIAPILNRLSPHKKIAYANGLALYGALMVIIWLGVKLVFDLLASLSVGIPF